MSVPNIKKTPQMEIEELYNQFQDMSRTLSQQKNQTSQLGVELRELESATDILSDITDDSIVYKQAGSVLVKREAGAVSQELNAQKELVEVRLKRSKNLEDQLGQRLQKIQETLQSKASAMESKRDVS